MNPLEAGTHMLPLQMTFPSLPGPQYSYRHVLEPGNKQSRNATKVSSTKGETIGHDPEALAKILAPTMAKETILSLETEVTGTTGDAPEENGCLAEG